MTKRQKYILTTKLIKIMKKILSLSMMAAMVLAMILLCLPCFLIFSQGPDGELTVWKFVGVAWTCMLAIVLKKVW